MSPVKDLYPSRCNENPVLMNRLDPVVYGSRTNGAAQGPLSQGELDQFERDGYLFFEGFFSGEALHAFQEELETLRHSESMKESEGVITEPGSGDIRSIFDVTKHSQLYFMLSRDQRIVDMMRQILGSEVYIHQTRVNFKPGFRGKEFYWHSDFETWHVEDGMPRMRAISCSIALTENTPFNGPLMVIPGSHKHYVACTGETPDDNYKNSLKKQEYGVPDDENLTTLAEQGGIVAPTGPAGSLLMFECNLMHGSNSNISPQPRSNVFLVYNSVENALVDPFHGKAPRPEFLASHDFQPVSPINVNSSYEIFRQEAFAPAAQ